MRNIININADWLFQKPNCEIEAISLPHTWNKVDGQDGGNDYYRGTCRYTKKIAKSDLPAGEQIYLEFEGANASATVFVNGKEVGSHDGGYSTWRVNITEAI